mmetsp:Transcript_36946/g.81099  ORF Transcript_36946/g.81099 Transcript_36946/m.81099 type:complete len:224 (-) Transcript_36946:76-747(-)
MGMMPLMLGCYFVYFLLFAMGACWLWPEFVDDSEPPRIRGALLFFLLLESCVEVAVWSCGAVKAWVIVIVVLANCWGMLDALLRYPVVHDVDTFFSVKQAVLIVSKFAGYGLGFKNMSKHAGWFILMVLVCIFTVPVLWLTALPIGDFTRVHQKHGRVDVDLAVRIWRFISDPTERAAAASQCQRWLRQALVVAAKAAPGLRNVILKKDPTLARMMQKDTRRV